MKKLMFAFVVVAMAIIAQANSVVWSAKINGATASTPVIAAGCAYSPMIQNLGNMKNFICFL